MRPRISHVVAWTVRRRRICSHAPPEHRARPVTEITIAGDDRELRVRHLALASFAAELPHHLDDVVETPDVRLGEQSPVRVDRHLAAKLDPPAPNPVLRPSPPATPGRVDAQEHGQVEAAEDTERAGGGGSDARLG